MPRAKLSVRPAGAALAIAVVLAGCASKEVDPTANWSPNRIYEEARDEANSASYDKAIALFEKLEGRAAGTVLAQQAQLEKAYAQYKNGDKAQAIATLDRFMKLHPTSEAIDYALYLKGLVNFNDNLGFLSSITQQDLSERDQKAAKESFEAFRELVQRFPNSKYAADAAARMRYIINSLAQYEVHVARYYLQRGAYVAAVNRAQAAIADYRDAPANEEALYILVRAYDALGLAELRDDAKRVLDKNFPNSAYLSQGFKGKDGPWWKLW
ncbi:outer membrane protein assembly factor BamD [Tibeticola sp.]|uniref:outer membrane protein assembly factor BamD n=1 Tax=Tibeticola sp. TaxID=2005368 RepID=UPI002585AED0|nr:outer membrane protein assembly factor BamD [Tibeticola sp.]MCI4440947.1 outer membrane protein assembly factor BamD [Tibeticola sp.]